MSGGSSSIAKVADAIEGTLALPEGFMRALMDEDDWSFVIKAHALLEAAASDLLTAHVGDQRLKPIFRQLELSNVRTGKIAFLSKLDLLTTEQRAFIRKFSEIRNQLVHRVENSRFELLPYITALEEKQRSALSDAVARSISSASDPKRWREVFGRDPKFAMFFAVFGVVLHAHLGAHTARSERDLSDRQIALMKKVLAEPPADSL